MCEWADPVGLILALGSRVMLSGAQGILCSPRHLNRGSMASKTNALSPVPLDLILEDIPTKSLILNVTQGKESSKEEGKAF